MKYIAYLIPVFIVLAGCGQKSNEVKQALNIIENGKEIGENLEKENKAAQDRKKARIERGDTQALHYEKLAKFLPESIDGFEKKGEMQGSTTAVQGLSYSNASQTFVNPKGDEIMVTVFDYNAAENLYSGVTTMYSMGMEIDDNSQKAKGFKKNDDIIGWEVFHKDSKKAEVFAGVVSRFYVTIEADNQTDTEFAKEVLNQFALDEMSAL